MDTETKQNIVSRVVVSDELNNVSAESEEIDITPLLDSELKENLSNTNTHAPEFCQNQHSNTDVDVNNAQDNRIAAESSAPQSTSETLFEKPEMDPRTNGRVQNKPESWWKGLITNLIDPRRFLK